MTRSLREGDWQVVKRSGRDKQIWVVIHMCMQAMLGISLYSYPYLKLAKMLCLSYYCLCLLFNKTGEQEGRTGSAWMRSVVQIMCTHVNKCKNNKTKF
jgi:hypothetical protein